MLIEAVVPAWNESRTVADAVHPLLASGAFSRVTVIDDGSTDNTADVARAAGASVYTMPKNGGKGGAMRAGVEQALARGAGAVAFFDADLIGLRPDHVGRLTAPLLRGEAVMVCGLRDHGRVQNALQVAMPPITGERVVAASVLRAVPAEFWSGFRIEAAINAVARRQGAVLLTILDGLGIVHKTEKFGVHDGAVRYAKMFREVLEAMRDAEGMPR